ncbi:MAG: hypothetical protein QF464_15665 [Myxococcota bacterium]|nr:hypothetical protein [Myxococcota bacterium]
MTSIRTTLRALPAILLASILVVGCDGAVDGELNTSTHALTAALDRGQPSATFDIVIRVSEPTSSAIDHFERAGTSGEVEAGFDAFGSIDGVEDIGSSSDIFSTTIESFDNNEYVGEREARDAMSEPVYAVLPLATCGGIYPCELALSVTFERHDFTREATLVIDGLAWAGAEGHQVEILDVQAL